MVSDQQCYKYTSESTHKNGSENLADQHIQFLWHQLSKAIQRDHFVSNLSVCHALLLLVPHVFCGTLFYQGRLLYSDLDFST